MRLADESLLYVIMSVFCEIADAGPGLGMLLQGPQDRSQIDPMEGYRLI